MNFHSISLVFTLKTIVEEQICAINEVIGYTWAIAQSPQRGNQETPTNLYFQTFTQSLRKESLFQRISSCQNRAAYRVYLYEKLPAL